MANATKDQCNSYISSNNLEFVSMSGKVFLVKEKSQKQNISLIQNAATNLATNLASKLDPKDKPQKQNVIKQNTSTTQVKKLTAYAGGLHNAPKDEIAWTQEKGQELLLSPTRDSILTTIKKGDSVLTVEETENLFKLSQMDPAELKKKFMDTMVFKNPDLSSPAPSTTNNAVNNNDVDVHITIPNVTHVEEFANFLQSSQTTRYIRELVADGLLGKNEYRRYNRKLV